MSRWQGKTRGGVAGYKTFVFVIKHLGLSFAYFLLKIVAVYYFLHWTNPNKAQYIYFRKIHKYNPLKSFISVYRNFCMLGKILVDKIAMLSGAITDYTYDSVNEHYLISMFEGNTGGILVNAHVGNWEIAGKFLENLNKPINILIYDAEHEQIKRYLSGVLVNNILKFIVVKNDFSHLEQIQKALNNHEVIAMNGDRYVEGNRTITCRFMGYDAEFPISPFYMAAKYNVPVMFSFAIKINKKHYRIIASEIKYIKGFQSLKTRDEALKNIVHEYAEMLESIVKQYPLQWFNFYNFWKLTS